MERKIAAKVKNPVLLHRAFSCFPAERDFQQESKKKPHRIGGAIH
jgi:hypothetical protein